MTSYLFDKKEENPKLTTRWHLIKLIVILGVYQMEAVILNQLLNGFKRSNFLPADQNTFFTLFGSEQMDLFSGFWIFMLGVVLFFDLKFKRKNTKQIRINPFELLLIFLLTSALLFMVFLSIERVFFIHLVDSFLFVMAIGVSALQVAELRFFLDAPKEYYESMKDYQNLFRILCLFALTSCCLYAFRVLNLGDLTLEGSLSLAWLIGFDMKLSQINSRRRLYEQEHDLRKPIETLYIINSEDSNGSDSDTSLYETL